MNADKKCWKLQDGMEMTLDGIEHRFHVRERDNRIAIVLSQPGWAAATGYDYWYVSIEELKPTGQLDEGQAVCRWNHRSTHPGGVGFNRAMKIAMEWYVREARSKDIPMSIKKCFCGGDGKYVDYNCGADFYVSCPHCQGTGQKKCDCKEVSLVCKTYGCGQEIVEPSRDADGDDNPHWMFMD